MGNVEDMGDVVTWWDVVSHGGPWGHEGDMGDMETSWVMDGTEVGMTWEGIGDMERGYGRRQDMGRHGDTLVWGHHPGDTLGTC